MTEKMIKGSVLENALQFLREQKGDSAVQKLEADLGTLVFDSHSYYPLEQFLQLQKGIIALTYPNEVERGLNVLGRYAFNSYAKSLLGGTMINHIENAQELLEQVQIQWNQVLNFGQRSLADYDAENHTSTLEIQDDPRPPGYLAGIIEAGLESIGLSPQVSFESIGEHNYKFLIRW